jgi:hypothetical protein
MAGLAVLGLAFYTITMREGMTIMSTPPFAPSDVYIITTAFFWTLIALLSIGLFALLKNLRIGEYFAFLALVASLFAPYDNQSETAPLTVVWWLAIPNVMVGTLLLKTFSTLSPANAGIVMMKR